MSRRSVIVGVCILSFAAGLGPILAQSPGETPAAEDLQAIRTALVRIADSLERQEENQTIELLIKRIEVHEKRLEPIQRRLAEAEKTARKAESDFNRIERLRSDMERTLEAQSEAGPGSGPGEGMRPMLLELDRQLESSRVEHDTAQQRLRSLQVEMSDGRQAITALDEQLDESMNPRGE